MPTSRRRALKQRMLGEASECHYCECEIDANSATLDHIIPQSSGGRDKPENLVLACSFCNTCKASLPYDVFVALIRAPVPPAWEALGWKSPKSYKDYVKRRTAVCLAALAWQKRQAITWRKTALAA